MTLKEELEEYSWGKSLTLKLRNWLISRILDSENRVETTDELEAMSDKMIVLIWLRA